MEQTQDLAVTAAKLNSLSNIYSVWHYNKHLRVTFVASGWLVVWDHRDSPPQRYDIKVTGDHATTCKHAAEQLQELMTEHQLDS